MALDFQMGTAPTQAFGTKMKFVFSSDIAEGDTWTVRCISTLSGNFTLGKGNIAGQDYSCGYKLRNRVYLGFGQNFALSSIEDPPNLWEEQDAGSAVISYLSQAGPQDVVTAFASIQGRLSVFGRKSIQIWQADADPALFQLLQTLNNIGTQDPESVQNIGDLDVMFLHDSGFRSLRAREATLNAYVSDVGTPIDALVVEAFRTYEAGSACGIVEPTSGQYWCYLNGNIYVLSQYPESKITAWSTYKPTTVEIATPDSAVFSAGDGVTGTLTYSGLTVGNSYFFYTGNATALAMTGLTTLTGEGEFVATDTVATVSGPANAAYLGALYDVAIPFTPVKMVLHEGQVFIRGADRKIYRYGGEDNNSYDVSRMAVELPWLDFEEPSMRKTLQAAELFIAGRWNLFVGNQPGNTDYRPTITRGSLTSPNMVVDSTTDKERFPINGTGTHAKLKMTSFTNGAAKLSALNVIYTPAGTK